MANFPAFAGEKDETDQVNIDDLEKSPKVPAPDSARKLVQKGT